MCLLSDSLLETNIEIWYLLIAARSGNEGYASILASKLGGVLNNNCR